MRPSEMWDEAADLNLAIRVVAMRHRALAAAALAGLGLAPGQEVVLFELADNGPCTQVKLAGAAGCEPPTMTSAVRKLEALGLVTRTRCEQDARAMVVALSDDGQELVPRLRQAWIALARDTLAGLPEDRAAAIRRALRELAGHLRREAPECGGSACPGPA